MITIIAAIARNGVIGKNSKLPWHIPEDLHNFKKQTLGSTVIMGRKTFESIGRPLPNRSNIVLSSSLTAQEGIMVCKTIPEALEKAKNLGKEIYIIGGSAVYQDTIPLADRMILSHLKKEYEGDAYFLEFDKNQWHITLQQDFTDFELVTYMRKK